MLILTIKEGQLLHIGDNIKIEFNRKTDFDPLCNRVSVAISAPKEVTVLREELTRKNRSRMEPQL